MRTMGLEPTPPVKGQESESCASANSAMSARTSYFIIIKGKCQYFYT